VGVNIGGVFAPPDQVLQKWLLAAGLICIVGVWKDAPLLHCAMTAWREIVGNCGKLWADGRVDGCHEKDIISQHASVLMLSRLVTEINLLIN
jgi:hypothetical protein